MIDMPNENLIEMADQLRQIRDDASIAHDTLMTVMTNAATESLFVNAETATKLSFNDRMKVLNAQAKALGDKAKLNLVKAQELGNKAMAAINKLPGQIEAGVAKVNEMSAKGMVAMQNISNTVAATGQQLTQMSGQLTQTINQGTQALQEVAGQVKSVTGTLAVQGAALAGSLKTAKDTLMPTPTNSLLEEVQVNAGADEVKNAFTGMLTSVGNFIGETKNAIVTSAQHASMIAPSRQLQARAKAFITSPTVQCDDVPEIMSQMQEELAQKAPTMRKSQLGQSMYAALASSVIGKAKSCFKDHTICKDAFIAGNKCLENTSIAGTDQNFVDVIEGLTKRGALAVDIASGTKVTSQAVSSKTASKINEGARQIASAPKALIAIDKSIERFLKSIQ